ncbi:hypothetical protein G7054_g11694 [Neopestalotiopsis clavispora]|nr:hypothetical protein G7054_g11694 [Neopestalotiopsis clavispora]
MGGKLWSDPEERYFWRVIIPQSVKRVIPTSLNQPPKSWPDLAAEMNTAMGNEARRRYTGTMLFEHYFQNIDLERVSPNAGRYVRKFLKTSGRLDHSLLKVYQESDDPFGNAEMPIKPEVQIKQEDRSGTAQASTHYSKLSNTSTIVVFTGLPRQYFNVPNASRVAYGPSFGQSTHDGQFTREPEDQKHTF